MKTLRRTHVSPAALVAAGLLLLLVAPTGCRKHDPGSFATPEEAVAAVDQLIGTGDQKRIEEIFGPGSMDLFQSGDDNQDRRAGRRVKAMIAEKVAFEEHDAATRVALFGNHAWPFPIPLVQKDGRWRFDTAAGRDELINRRVGFNELSTLYSLHEYVDAQREYAAEGRDGNPPAFAQRFLSTSGRHDGLYWPSAEGETESPLGDLLANATSEMSAQEGPQPYNGYYFRILTGQGKNAPGGERNYLNAKGHLTGGFAAVAWPAEYGHSGVMSFQVSQRGVVYQKDLGAETETLAAAIQAFDPDESWAPTGDSLGHVEEAEDEVAAEADDAAAEGSPAGAAD